MLPFGPLDWSESPPSAGPRVGCPLDDDFENSYVCPRGLRLPPHSWFSRRRGRSPPRTLRAPKRQPALRHCNRSPRRTRQRPRASTADRSQAYYHDALASVYEDNAIAQGQQEYANRAIEEYKLALNADPNSAQLAQCACRSLLPHSRPYPRRRSTARNLLKTSPDDVPAHKLLGRIYLRQLGEGQNAGASANAHENDVLDQAITEFEKIVALQPRSVEDRMVLGQLYTVKHDQKKAEEQFKTAQEIEPDSEDVVLNMARLYADSGDLQHAAKVIADVASERPHPKNGIHAGRHLRPDEAAQECHRSLQARRRHAARRPAHPGRAGPGADER